MSRLTAAAARSIATFILIATALAVAPAESASLSGSVSYDGPEFRMRAIRMDADPKCAALHEGERVRARDRIVSDEGGVANVFVYIQNPPAGEYPPPAEPKQLLQHGCLYEPRVQGILVDQQLEVINDDPTLHNVRFMARANRPFNLGQPAKGKRVKTFVKPEEAVRFKCDVHPWMASYLFVMDHPFFAVTDEAGRFRIENLPAGTYQLAAWHETFGRLEQTVTVTDDGAAVELTFTGDNE